MFDPNSLRDAAISPPSATADYLCSSRTAIEQSSIDHDYGGTEIAGRLRKGELWRIAAPKQERFFFGGCFLVFWLIGAASLSGYIMLALFLLVAIGRLVQHAATAFATNLAKRSRLRHYIVMGTSVAFFSLLVVRGCYLAASISSSAPILLKSVAAANTQMQR